MNCKKVLCLGVIVSFLGLCSPLRAQLQTSPWSAGISAGTLVYQGDLVPTATGNLKTLRPSIGLHVTRDVNTYFSVRANLIFGKLASNEAAYSKPTWRSKRALAFSTPVTEVSGLLVFEPLGHYDGYGSRLRPYVFGGIGLAALNVDRDYSRFDTTVYHKNSAAYKGLAIDSTQAPPGIIATLPIGGGLQYHFNTQWSVYAQGNLRITGSDYLDGFKYAASPGNNDRFYGISVGINYRFGGYKCPAAR